MTPKLLINTEFEAGASEAEGNCDPYTFEPAPSAGHAAVVHLVQRIFLSSEQPLRQVLFSSVDEHRGATEISLLVARLLAQSGQTVCLVDAHTCQPRLGNRSGAVRAPAHQLHTNLWLVSSDPLLEANVLSAQKEQLIRLRGEYDYVLVDAPSIGHSEDAAVLGSMADCVILVLRAGVTRRIAALRAKQRFEEAGITVLGAVLQDRTFPIPDAIYRRI